MRCFVTVSRASYDINAKFSTSNTTDHTGARCLTSFWVRMNVK
jgi:hypothetical protein